MSQWQFAKSSHTLRGCVDWNCYVVTLDSNFNVTPFVGVWIETWAGSTNRLRHCSHTLRGCVDWNKLSSISSCSVSSHTLRGCVDWNKYRVKERRTIVCHTLRGCVDWNNFVSVFHIFLCVTPFVGVWIETIPNPSNLIAVEGHTLRGCVDWNNIDYSYDLKVIDVTPFVGVWIETSTIIPDSFKGNVTPFVGVWIETAGSRICLENPVSHPSWVCGLKRTLFKIW